MRRLEADESPRTPETARSADQLLPTVITGVVVDIPGRTRQQERSEEAAHGAQLAEALGRVSAALGPEHELPRLDQAIVDSARRLTQSSLAALVAGGEVRAASGSRPRELGEGIAAWLRTAPAGEVAVLHDLAEEGDTYIDVLAALGLRSLVSVPLPGGRRGGVATLVLGHPCPGHFDERRARALTVLALHAALALENAHLDRAVRREVALRQAVLEEREGLLAVLQRSLLPPELPAIEGLDLAARYLPMGAGIGGDFYDVFPLSDGGWGVALGDVCGKGPAAASTTGLARYTIRAAAMTEASPAHALAVLNQALLARDGPDARFCTAVFARLDVRAEGVSLCAAVAGHPPLLVLRTDGRLEEYGPTGPLLGVLEAVELTEVTLTLGPGDVCVLYTDGATDVRHGRETFGDRRLAEVVSSCRSMSATAVAHQIEHAVVTFQHGELRDDLAAMVLAVPPSPVR